MPKEADILSQIERKPENLICGLRRLQSAFGAITDDGVLAAMQYFGRSESDVEGIIAFYPHFVRSHNGKILIEVCNGRTCGRKGNFSALLKDVSDRFTVKTVECLGVCAQAPAIRVNGKLHTRIDRKKLAEILH